LDNIQNKNNKNFFSRKRNQLTKKIFFSLESLFRQTTSKLKGVKKQQQTTHQISALY
jgi:uncharacterized membrane protein